MKTRKAWKEGKRRTLVVALALLLAFLTTMPGMAQTGPNTISFQGRLLDGNGDPRSGEKHCLRFRMCSDSGCTTDVWPGRGYEEHNVLTGSSIYKAGLFSVSLGSTSPINPALLFDHDTLYLEIGVAEEAVCPGKTWSTMTPRSQIQTAAYAQRSRRVRNEESDDDYLISVNNTGQGGGISAQTDSTTTDTYAAYFHADGETGRTRGVYAINDSSDTFATAGYFTANASTGQTNGVYALNRSTGPDAAAGYFYAGGESGGTVGVKGVNRSTTSGAIAGSFRADGASGQTYGVYGETNSTSDYASAGRFYADGESGATYGVYAKNDSSTGGAPAAAAGYFLANGLSGATNGVYAKNRSTSDNAKAGYFLADGASGKTSGVYVENRSTSPSATAGHFYAIGGEGATRGVYARNDSTTEGASAGYFLADGASGKTDAVYAENRSTTHYAAAGSFYANGNSGATYGVYAKNNSSTGGAAAGYFHADRETGQTRAVYARNDSTMDAAAAGWFRADGTSGATHAVYAVNVSTDTHSNAGYFYAADGVAIKALSQSNNIIEAYSSSTDREFYVSNAGHVYADGDFHTGGADFAEMLPGADDLEPGDVLVIGPDGQLARSSEAYASAVVGVYSTEPGFVGGSDEERENPGKVPLAILGVVPCKASAENGSIRPGDLLVTSATPGHAMRAGDNPPQGTVVGKALEALETSTGVIQMLVTLQ